MGNRRLAQRVRFRRGDEPLGPGKRASVVVLAAWAVSLLAGSMAAAQVIGDPDGNVTIGTEGEDVSARHVAVSNGGNAFARNVAVSHGGNASTWPVDSVALSTTGSANGYLATSATGCSDSDVGVALSVTGCATGWRVGASGTGWSDSAYLAASGTQCAYSTTVGVSATGCAEGWLTALSGTGNATGGMTALSGTGNANSGIVAASGLGGGANGVLAAVSAGGDAWASSPSGVALSGVHSSNGATAVSGTGDSSGAVAVSGTGNANGSSMGVDAGNGKVTNGGVTVIDLTGTGDSQVAEALELTTVVPVPDGTSEIVAGGMEILTTGLDSLPPTPSIDPTGVVSMSNNNVPSCRNITYRGNAGAIYVQVGDNGYLQWGIYMYNSAENNGHWWVDAYVNGKRKDSKNQMYAPHGSLPPSIAPRGSTFQIVADLYSNSGRRYRNVPNKCRIP